MTVVTRGLGGYALVTRGLGGFLQDLITWITVSGESGVSQSLSSDTGSVSTVDRGTIQSLMLSNDSLVANILEALHSAQSVLERTTDVKLVLELRMMVLNAMNADHEVRASIDVMHALDTLLDTITNTVLRLERDATTEESLGGND